MCERRSRQARVRCTGGRRSHCRQCGHRAQGEPERKTGSAIRTGVWLETTPLETRHGCKLPVWERLLPTSSRLSPRLRPCGSSRTAPGSPRRPQHVASIRIPGFRQSSAGCGSRRGASALGVTLAFRSATGRLNAGARSRLSEKAGPTQRSRLTYTGFEPGPATNRTSR